MDNKELKEIVEQAITPESIQEAVSELFEKAKETKEGIEI